MILQTQSLSAAEAQSIAADSIDTLKGMRSDEKFKLFFQLVESLRVRLDCEEPVLPRKRKAPRHLENGNEEAYHSFTTEEHYRIQYFEALDLAVTSIQDRFDQPGYATYRFKILSPFFFKVANQTDYSTELQEVVSFYGDAVTSIQDHFDQPGYATYKNLESLLLKVANQTDYSSELQEVVLFYGDAVTSIQDCFDQPGYATYKFKILSPFF